jgi:hypothetical protein
MPKETTKEQRPKKGEQMQHECVHAVRKTNKKKKNVLSLYRAVSFHLISPPIPPA